MKKKLFVALALASIAFAGVLRAKQSGARSAAAPLAPLANPVVNAPDIDSADRQDTTALVIGSGSLIAAFEDAGSLASQHNSGFSRSTDGGLTWIDGGILPPNPFIIFEAGHPGLVRDEVSGTVYFLTHGSSIGLGTEALVWRSHDDGMTWGSSVAAYGACCAHSYLENEHIGVDNYAGTGQGYVYVLSMLSGFVGGEHGMFLSRSMDGGSTFSTVAITRSEGSPYLSLAVAPDHAVHTFWFNRDVNTGISSIRVVNSTDFGQTFAPPVTVATLTSSTNGDLGLDFPTNSIPHVAVNGANGDLYVVYNDNAGSDKADIFLTRSSDGGTTWSMPITVNNDGPYLTEKHQCIPSVAVTPDGKHLFVTWYDRRSDPSNSLIEKWGVIATLGAASGGNIVFGPNFRISTGSWPVVVDGGGLISRYDGAVADNQFFYTTWGDNRLPNPVVPSRTHQADVRFAKIPVTGPPFGDFDRDLQTDRTFYRPSNGAWYTAGSNGGATTTYWGAAGDIDVPGDYDGDGTTDIAVWRPSIGVWFIVQSSNGAVSVTGWGFDGDIPLAGDVDGDGKDDLIIFRSSAGAWFVQKSGGGTSAVGWGIDGDQPLLGDFDGDGRTDVTVFRPSTGVWYAALAGGGTVIVGWGSDGDIPVAGDFDGDGKSDPAIFRPNAGEWWVQNSSGGTTYVLYGTAGDIPVSGDLDGDGRSDFTLWRPSNGIWYTQFAVGGYGFASWGTSGDKPIGRRPGS